MRNKVDKDNKNVNQQPTKLSRDIIMERSTEYETNKDRATERQCRQAVALLSRVKHVLIFWLNI